MLALGAALVALLAACDTTSGDRTPEPLAIAVTVAPESVATGGSVALTATISGAGAKPDGVEWHADGGDLSGVTGTEVSWTAPSQPGAYTITAELTAGAESVSGSAEVRVTAEGTEPTPLTISISAAPGAYYGQTLTLTATVEGDGADDVTVAWAAAAGALAGTTGLSTNWTAPPETGPVAVTATVEGDDATDTHQVQVQLCTSGDVTSLTDPCMLSNVHQLQAMNEHLSGHFALAGDIDAAETATWNGDAGFSPIGLESGGSFSGTFDGRGFKVDDLRVYAPDADNVGLFSQVGASGTLENVHLLNVFVGGADYTGALAGRNSGTIRGSSSTGRMAGGNYTGGLVGYNEGMIENSSSSVLVSGRVDLYESRRIGGLVGGNQQGGVIRKSFTQGSLVEDDDAPAFSSTGGLVGINWGVIEDSYSGHEVLATGSYTGGLVGNNQSRADGGGSIVRSFTTSESKVTGTLNTGGLVGISFGLIEHSYSLSNPVEGTNNVGGLVGNLRLPPPSNVYVHSGQVRQSYSMSGVQGDDQVGGLVGSADAGTEVARSYWDVQRSGQDTSAGGGTPQATAQMVHAATFSGWDFDNVWTINEGSDTPDLVANPRPPVE